MYRYLRMLLICAAVLALMAGPVVAATSPAGIVVDEAGALTGEQLRTLDEALTGLRYQYRVILLAQAFNGTAPTDANARFGQMAHDLQAQRNVPKDAVLITIAMKERMVDFRVYGDGPVNQAFLSGTGREFSGYTDVMLERFRGPAGQGDMAGGIIAAVKAIEAMVPVTAPAPAPSPTPAPVPSPSPEPSRDIDLVMREPVLPVAPAEPVNRAPILWGLGGVAVLALAGFWVFRYVGYRKQAQATFAVRDSFLGALLNLMEKEFPLARKYQGEHTRTAVDKAIAAADAALHTQQEAEPFRIKAERLARFALFGGALRKMAEADRLYRTAADQFKQSLEAWEPVSFALRHWGEESDKAGAGASKAGAALSAQRTRTGWALNTAEARLKQGTDTLEAGRRARDLDPVKAVRLVQEAGTLLEDVAGDLEALAGLEQGLEARRGARQQAVAVVEEARRTLGLRFVELSPEPPLAQALAQEQAAGKALPEGDADGARTALQGVDSAVQEALAIVERYRQALQDHPVLTAELREQIPVVESEQGQATGTLQALSARFDREDWDDVDTVSDDLGTFAAQARTGLSTVAELTSPSEQRYLKAVDLLRGWLAHRAELSARLAELTGRPAQLEELVRRASAELQGMDRHLEAAHGTMMRDALRLTPSLANRLDEAQRDLGRLQAMGQTIPIPARRWAKEAADGAMEAGVLREQVEELARQAAMARSELNRAQMGAGAALSYAMYNGSAAASLRSSLAAAEHALVAGQYGAALSAAQDAQRAAQALHAAYDAYLREQRRQEEERRRREEEARRASETSSNHSSSGGGGSWGSSSSNDNKSNHSSSGGGGNW